MPKENLLYTIRNYRINKKNTGIIITLSALSKEGHWQTINAYIPFKSQFEESATAAIYSGLSGIREKVARITIPTEKIITDKEI